MGQAGYGLRVRPRRLIYHYYPSKGAGLLFIFIDTHLDALVDVVEAGSVEAAEISLGADCAP